MSSPEATAAPKSLRISPTWHVTADQGAQPMSAPTKQSRSGTRTMPDAMLRPDQGTTPIRRRIERRAHGARACSGSSSSFESNAVRVTSTARGRTPSIQGLRGREMSVEKRLPVAVRNVIIMVPFQPPQMPPAITLRTIAPGTDQACFHNAMIDITMRR